MMKIDTTYITHSKEALIKELEKEKKQLFELENSSPPEIYSVFIKDRYRDVRDRTMQILVCKMNIYKFQFMIDNYGEYFLVDTPVLKKEIKLPKGNEVFTLEYKIEVYKKDKNEQQKD